jgi:hypothetical protein
MSNISQLSAAQLRHAAEVQTKIESLQAELAKVLGGTASPGPAATVRRGRPPGRKRKLSAAGRARIIAATKAYWAKVKAGAPPAARPAKRAVSAAGRARLVAIAKARWAKAKAAGKSKRGGQPAGRVKLTRDAISILAKRPFTYGLPRRRQSRPSASCFAGSLPLP